MEVLWKMEKCINQIFRPQTDVRIEGKGECKKCISHPDNINCVCYSPAKITIYNLTIKKEADYKSAS